MDIFLAIFLFSTGILLAFFSKTIIRSNLANLGKKGDYSIKDRLWAMRISGSILIIYSLFEIFKILSN